MTAVSDIDWRLFYRGPLGVRTTLFNGRMTQQQVDGINRVSAIAFDEFGLGVAHTSYILATSYHETGKRMHPVREGYGTSDADTIRRLDAAYKAGKLPWVRKPYWRSGYFGRGEVQLTWLTNYKKMQRVVAKYFPDVNIVENPNVLLDRPEVSSLILVYGMVHGLFTGHKLADFGDGNPRFDFATARDIVNPNEFTSDELIAGYAIKFMQAFERAIR